MHSPQARSPHSLPGADSDDPEALRARIAELEAQVRALVAERHHDAGERREAEAALHHTAESLRLAMDAARLGTWEDDLAAGIFRLDARARTMYALPEATPPSALLERIHPADRARMEAEIGAAVDPARRGPVSTEYRVVHPDGAVHWLRVQGRVEFSGDGDDARALRGMGIVQDVTAPRQAEEALRRSVTRYRTLFDSIDEGFCVLQMIFDDDGQPVDYRFLEANPAFVKHTGLPQDAVGRTAREMLPELEEHWFRIYGEVALTGEATRFESGSDVMGRWFDVFAFRVEEPEERKVALLFKDVSSQKKIEHDLRHSVERYQSLFDSIDEGFCVIEVLFGDDGNAVDYRFLEANPAFVKHSGLEGAIGKWMRELAPTHEEHWFRTYGHVARTGRPTRFEAPAEALGRWYDVFAFRVDAPAANHVAVLFTDITAYRDAEEEREQLLRDAESARAEAEAANRAKADFLASMSHELRTPLNAIGGYVELLEMGIHGALSDAQRSAMARITANQRHLLMLINDILSFARVEAGSIQFDLAPLSARDTMASVESLVAPQAEAKGVAYTTEPCAPELRFVADAERVRQILLNLVGNAVKFTREGGWVVLACDADDAWVCLRVRDNGVGIPEDEQERIFDPFQQVGRRLSQPQEGVGLGLAISRDLARAMHGDLTVRSTPGEGSTFTLRLPRAST